MVFRSAVSLVSVYQERSDNHSSRDAGALASSGLSPLLAVEVELAGRAAADRGRAARFDPTNEHREPDLGCTAYSWRVAQARLFGRTVDGGQIHGQAIGAVKPGIELVWINVTQNPTADWIARQLTEAFPWDEAPHYLIRDTDHFYGDVAQRRIRAMGIRDKPIAPAAPWQNSFAERLIGSIRRECLDHLVWSEVHLRRILQSYAEYYNKIRTHRSLDKARPSPRSADRQHCVTRYLRRASSPLCADLVFGTHTPSDARGKKGHTATSTRRRVTLMFVIHLRRTYC